jgi:hypothetical protein
MTRKITIEIEDVPETRWLYDDRYLRQIILRHTVGIVEMMTEGPISRVSVIDAGTEPTDEEIRRIHSAARAVHQDAKPCRCKICSPPTVVIAGHTVRPVR